MLSSLVSVSQLDRSAIEYLLAGAKRMQQLVAEHGGDDRLKRKVVATVFYEPSTRTHCSFQAAVLRLGGSVIPVNENSSSAQKGESLSDSILCLACYCDAIVLRHPMKGSAQLAASVSSKPIVNAGDGVGEHPTQALLDAFTIWSELDGIDGKTVTMLGDLKHGRTVHSLARLLALFDGITINYVSPDSLRLPEDVREAVGKFHVVQHEWSTLEEVLGTTDVLYVTRMQKERFESQAEYEAIKGAFVVDRKTMEKAKPRMIVMHPLPRVNEIATEVDADPRAVYFRQMEYGMYMRMALMSELLLGRI